MHLEMIDRIGLNALFKKSSKGVKMEKNGTKLLLFYLLTPVITATVSPVVSQFISQYIYLLILTSIAVHMNRYKFKYNIIIGYGFILSLVGINIIFSNNSQFIIPDAINLIMFSFLPIYLLSTGTVDFKFFSVLTFKTSIFLTILLPYFYSLRQSGTINYFDFGIVCHIAILCAINSYSIYQNNRRVSGLIIIINLIACLIFGSRTVALASAVCFFISLLFQPNKNRNWHNIKVSMLIVFVIYIFGKLKEIVDWLILQLASEGINSRNLSLLSMQLTQETNDGILSGRDAIYPVIIAYLKNNPIIPSGLGATRVLTNNMYYHSHNFLLEIMLIFGIPLALILMSIFIIYLYSSQKRLSTNTFRIVIILLISFFIRGTFGTHFISDPIFLLTFSIVIFNKQILVEQSIRNEELYENSID